jgi:type IV pilus assembly protein PilP
MKKRNSPYLLLVSLVGVLLIPGGCNKKEQPPPPPPAQTKPVVKAQPPVQKQQSSAKISGHLVASLDFTNRKDPFKPYAAPQVPAIRPAASTRTTDLLPIQIYDVSKFKVAGIIVGLKENTALVVDPAGKGYVVKEGMLIGNNDGKISKVTASSLEVAESYRDDNGHLRKRTIKLTLPQKK